MDASKVPAPVKRVVHLGSRSYGRITAPKRMTPAFLICGGQRCGTTSLYRELAGHPMIAEVAVVGVPDPVFGERVRAVAVLRGGVRDRDLPVAALREWAAARLADYKLPVELVTVGELPRNASGKVLKKQLAGLAAPAPATGARP